MKGGYKDIQRQEMRLERSIAERRLGESTKGEKEARKIYKGWKGG